jgi:hypothetical protein
MPDLTVIIRENISMEWQPASVSLPVAPDQSANYRQVRKQYDWNNDRRKPYKREIGHAHIWLIKAKPLHRRWERKERYDYNVH